MFRGIFPSADFPTSYFLPGTVSGLAFAPTSGAYGMFGMACGCCPAICQIGADSFAEADGGTVPGWTQDTGSSSISSHRLILTASNSRVIYDTQDDGTTGSVEIYARVDARATTSGDQARLVIKRKDASNYWWAQINFGASGTVELWSRVGGTNTKLASACFASTTTSAYQLVACYGGGKFQLIVNPGAPGGLSISAAVSTTINDAPYAALETGTITSQVAFTDFNYAHGFNATTAPSCSACTSGSFVCDVTRFSDDYSILKSGYSKAAACSVSGGKMVCTTGTTGFGVGRCMAPQSDANLVVDYSVHMYRTETNPAIEGAYTLQLNFRTGPSFAILYQWYPTAGTPGTVVSFQTGDFSGYSPGYVFFSGFDTPPATDAVMRILITSTSSTKYDVAFYFNGTLGYIAHNILKSDLHLNCWDFDYEYWAHTKFAADDLSCTATN